MNSWDVSLFKWENDFYHKIHIYFFDAFMNFKKVFMPFMNVLYVYQAGNTNRFVFAILEK